MQGYVPILTAEIDALNVWIYYISTTTGNFILFLIIYFYYSKYHTQARFESEEAYLECQALLFTRKMLLYLMSSSMDKVIGNFFVTLLINTLMQACIQQIPFFHHLHKYASLFKNKARQHLADLTNNLQMPNLHCDHMPPNTCHMKKVPVENKSESHV